MAERRLTGLSKTTRRDAVLGQSRPANTTAVTIYSPTVNVVGYVQRIHVCNTTGTAATCRLFLDNDGNTYDETTALEFDKLIGANNSLEFDYGEKGLPMSDDAGNLAVRTGTASALTFTAWGYEILGNG
jgi:hypothetical protein